MQAILLSTVIPLLQTLAVPFAAWLAHRIVGAVEDWMGAKAAAAINQPALTASIQALQAQLLAQATAAVAKPAPTERHE